VWGTPICVSTKAILWKRSTGTGPDAWDNHDIDFIIDRLEIPAKGPFANLSPTERWQLALKYPYFRRSFGVDSPLLPPGYSSSVGAWSYLPTPCNILPQGCKIAMRWRGEPYAYWIGLAVSQDFLTDLGNMIYTGGMCFSANLGGVNPQDRNKYQDIFKGLIPANLSSADSASSLFPFIKEICDPDGQVELRFKPSGVTQASARTGIEFPSDKVAGAGFDTFPYERYLGVNIPQTCSEWGYGRCADVVFGFPSYKMELWCNQNNLGPGRWIKDGHVGSPIYALAMTMSWLLGVDIDYPQVPHALTVSFKKEPGGSSVVAFPAGSFDGGSCTFHVAPSGNPNESDILEYWIRLDTNDTICQVNSLTLSPYLQPVDMNGVPISNPKLLCPDQNCTGGFRADCRCPELNWYKVKRRAVNSSNTSVDVNISDVIVIIGANGGVPGTYTCDIMGIRVTDRLGRVKCEISSFPDYEKFKNPRASVPYSVAFRRTGDIFFFFDLKSNIQAVASPVLLPYQLINGIGDYVGDLFSGWLQARFATKFNLPLVFPLHFVFKKIKPEGPDVAGNETGFYPWSPSYPVDNPAPDYLAIYIDKLLWNIDLLSLINSGTLSVAPKIGVAKPSVKDLISVQIPECEGKERCALTPDVARKYFRTLGPNTIKLKLLRGDVEKISWRRNGSAWKIPIPASNEISLDLGILPDGMNTLEIAPITFDGEFLDEKPFELAIYMDTQPPYILIRGGREYETGIMYFSGVPVFVLDLYDASGEVWWAYKVDDGEWSEWQKGSSGRIKLDKKLSKGTHTLHVMAKDKWDNRTTASKIFYYGSEGVMGCRSASEVDIQEVVFRVISVSATLFPIFVIVLMRVRNIRKKKKKENGGVKKEENTDQSDENMRSENGDSEKEDWE
jgi:hypothetical protein